MKSADSISKTSISLLLSEPFYGHFMLGLPREVSLQVQTVALSLMNRQMVKLVVNEAFWDGLTPEHRYGLVKHEMLHIVLKHLFMMKNYPNKLLFNLAADLVVNQYIDRKQLPKGEILLEQFSYLVPMFNITLEQGKGLDYYYHNLNKIFKTEALMSFEDAITSVGLSENDNETPIKIELLLSEENKTLGRHRHWEAFEKLSTGERKIVTYQVDRMIKQTTERVRHKYQNFGHLPKVLADQLTQILEDMKPRFNWRRALRLFATSSNSSFIKNTIRRPSKRYTSVPGIQIKRRNRLLLAIDTSGSLSQKEWLDFFTEIYFIWRQGAAIRIVECDTDIRQTYDYIGTAPMHVHGRGDTSFDAPIKYGNEIYRPDALIYFTDGFAATPKIAARFLILWVVSPDGLKEGEGVWNDLPGRKLKMNHLKN